MRPSLNNATNANAAPESEENRFEDREYYRVLFHQLIMNEEEERRRLRREVGDQLTQQLAALAIQAGMLEEEAQKSATPLLTRISEIKNCSVKLAEHAHRFCKKLYPAILEDLGLVEAIRSECLAFQQEEGIEVRFRSRAVPVRFTNRTSHLHLSDRAGSAEKRRPGRLGRQGSRVSRSEGRRSPPLCPR